MELETVSSDDILKSFASNDILQDFLDDEFDVQNYATKVIQNANISQQLAQLFDGISLLDKELQSQISARHEDLLAQATGIESLEGILTMMQTRINSLQSAIDRIRIKIGEPFNKIQARTVQLGRMQATCDLLRRIIRIQHLTKHLQQQLQGGAKELTKSAQTLSELEYVAVGVDLSGIEILDSDRAFIGRAKEEVNAQACCLLDQGIACLNQTHTSTALQVFYNLDCLHVPVQRASQEAANTVKHNIKTALDAKTILKRSSNNQNTKGPGKASTLSAPGNLSLFRANLWNNVEVLIDQLANSANQMIHLHKVLSKKRDPMTHVKFSDELSKSGDIYFVKNFWEILCKELEKELLNSVEASTHIKQSFEGEYPKLVRLFNEMWGKLKPNKDIIQGNFLIKKNPETKSGNVLPQPNSDYSPVQALKSSIRIFETAYLQRSISRLFDPINLVFPQGGRNPPSIDELDSIMKTMSSEISVASVDESLEVTVCRNIAKTVQLFAVKSEQLISTQGEASQVIGTPTTAQTRNVAVVNSLFTLQNNVLKLIDDQHFHSQEAKDIIRSSCHNLSILMANAVAPLIASVADSIEAILLTMHNENFSEESGGSGEAILCSLYMKELRDFLSRVVHDHFKLFQCQSFVAESLLPLGHRAIDLFVRHATLTRPIGEVGKTKLAADFAQMELAVSPLCRRLTDLGQSYRLLRSFRPILFQTEEAICESLSVGDVIPYSAALHFLFSRAPPDVRSPHQVMGWSLTKYSKWMDEHPTEKERLNMLRGAIENYVSSVRSGQQTQFASVYPFMMQLLQKGMEKIQ